MVNINYQFYDKIYEINKIHPFLEYKRRQYLRKIKYHFNSVIKKNISNDLLYGKKGIDHKLSSMFARFYFIQHIDPNRNFIDALLFNGKLNYLGLIDELNIILSFKQPKLIEQIIKELDLENKFIFYVEKLKKHSLKHDLPNYSIKLITGNIYKLKLVMGKYIQNVEINKKLYIKLKNSWNQKQNLHLLIWSLIYRYITIESYNLQLAVISNIMLCMKDNYKVDFELFGSPINHYFPHYCSLFYDLEKYFGSRGSFFTIKPIAGSYTANPPFDDTIINIMADKLLNHLQETDQPLRFIIWIPVWDQKSKEIINNKCNIKNKQPIKDYQEYTGYEKLIASKYLAYHGLVCLNDMPYTNYINFKNVFAANTHIIVIQNDKMDEFNDVCFKDIVIKKN